MTASSSATPPRQQGLRLGYGTNGFANHRLPDALAVIADLGYDGVALTVDHPHLDPFAPAATLAAETAALRRRLDDLGLAVVVETGARYVLDPWRKHEPNLVSATAEGRARRVDLLHRAVRVAADLGAEAVSFWSGTAPAGTTPAEGWERLVGGVRAVLDEAERHGVVCAFEPEPGMFVDTLATAVELRRRLGDPASLRLTLDIGHCVCNEPESLVACVHAAGPLLANVQLDDMMPGVHEHLEFGEGRVDLPAALGALLDVGYGGLAAVELPRHSHAAPAVARRSLEALTNALRTAVKEREEREEREEEERHVAEGTDER
ncbi:sugar phosphate isomerase/epimerase family protein [Streptomyces sp. 4N509B]|uniref:sugar phosphate isomerase/epimerase family protein n=1 Tax=Streptomyces sp. 4N509B TaxID=3457413 RepID=UPI003FD12E4A